MKELGFSNFSDADLVIIIEDRGFSIILNFFPNNETKLLLKHRDFIRCNIFLTTNGINA